MARVAVIGAGLTGLVVARALGESHDVTVYEKSRGVGGRLATRYAGDFEFDHGAQFFTARTAAFREFLAPLIEAGHVAPWQARFAEFSGPEITSSRRWDEDYPHYVGVPRMNVIGKVLAPGLDIRTGARVTSTAQTDAGWSLTIECTSRGEERADADWLIVTAPLEQALNLVPGRVALESAIAGRTMLGCYALMLGFDVSPALPFDAALVREADISWISVNSSKPGRAAAPTIVVHATNRWAEANMELELDAVLAHMVAELTRVTGFAADAAVHKDVQRWRYANSPKATGATHFLDTDNHFAVSGDWWIRGRVESAFSSANGLLGALKDVIA